ncbi:MAG TPA: serine protease [Solirubrobacterales bacterium]|nr:serine protease [Solirubrobacterales bacterium]
MRTWGYSGGRATLLLCALLVAVLAQPAAASAEGGAQASIVGGRAASIAEFPSLAYIQATHGRHGFSCTGTVVAPRVVLTAAHCVESIEKGALTPIGDYAVATGVANPRREAGPANVFRIAQAHVFPGFDPGSLHGDAAVLVLTAPTTAPPIALADPADAALYQGGAAIQLAGWGLTGAKATKTPDNLRTTGMVVQAPGFCKRKTRGFYPEYSTREQLCTLDPPSRKSGGCFGDSGGPAIGQRPDGVPVQLGIISTGGPFCSTELPNVMTRTDLVSPWVAQWIAAVETGAPPPALDPAAPFPTMSRRAAEEFTIFTLVNSFGRRFEGAREVFGSCRRASGSRFVCEVAWVFRRRLYAGEVSPFYVRRQGAVIWNSHFRIESAPLRCLRDRSRRCPVQTKRG